MFNFAQKTIEYGQTIFKMVDISAYGYIALIVLLSLLSMLSGQFHVEEILLISVNVIPCIIWLIMTKQARKIEII